uniref:Uncharacterized protein n=1 Tax=Meloidogyne enterolobii TaxID=390850 RepID=A0A6V7VTP9_MELEN|nr:unnamed protein product [Meloidogyne enterolobii]
MDLISSEQRHLLSIGRVPLLRKRSVRRHKLLDKLGERIEKFCDNSDSNWFLIFGMPGCGKTHLLNSLLWEKPEVSLALFDRVIWLTDRRMDEEGPLNLATDCLLIASLDSTQNFTEKREEIIQKDEVDMMIQVETEGLFLGSSQSLSIGNKLKTTLENIPKKFLLILDGVLKPETVRFFDEYKPNNCKILATSTSSDLFTSVDYLDIFRLEGDELEINELGQLLRKFGFEEQFNNEELTELIEKAGGNFALIEKLVTLARGNKDHIQMLLSEFSTSRRSLNEFTCNTPYPFNNLEGSIKQCLKMLSESLCRSFDFCSVLEPLAWTPFEVISLIWPLDICGNETESHLKSLISHQLQTIVCNSILDALPKNKNYSFTNYFRLQPIIHNFLLHSRTNSYKTFIKSSQILISKLKQKQKENNSDKKDENSDFYYFCFAQYLERNEQRLIKVGNLIGGKEKVLEF